MENSYQKKRILYVDDDLQSRLLVDYLIGKFYDITLCATAKEALQILETSFFSLILLDIRLEGEITGIELLSEIRKMPGHKYTPAVAVTAYAFDEDRELILSSGFTDYIAKPIALNQFKEMIKNYVEGKEVFPQ